MLLEGTLNELFPAPVPEPPAAGSVIDLEDALARPAEALAKLEEFWAEGMHVNSPLEILLPSGHTWRGPAWGPCMRRRAPLPATPRVCCARKDYFRESVRVWSYGQFCVPEHVPLERGESHRCRKRLQTAFKRRFERRNAGVSAFLAGETAFLAGVLAFPTPKRRWI